jgi:diguanylate cyclase (GGDEF)-like protein/PAS domain S-box-containing protein
MVAELNDVAVRDLPDPRAHVDLGSVAGQRADDRHVDAARVTDDLQQRLAAAEAALARAEAAASEFRQVADSMPQILWTARPDGWHTYFNQQWMDFTGLTLEQSLGFGWNPPFHPEDRVRAAARWEEATSTGEPYEIEYRLRRADGVYHWMLGRAMPLRDSSGRITKWFGTCTDIQELKQAQDQIAEQARLLDLAQDAIYVQDLDRRILYWNRGAERIYGWSPQEAVGRTLEELISASSEQVDAAVQNVIRHGDWSGELQFVERTGQSRVMEARWTLLRDGEGEPKGVLAVNTDVTERRADEARFIQMLEVEATHDPLTGLPNRTLLAVRLDEAVAASRTEDTTLACLFVDLDEFKDINDASGHLLGDQVLQEVAQRLQGVVRDGDTVARFGGDEFVVLLPNTDEPRACEVAERVLTAVGGVMEIDAQRLHVTASIGVAVTSAADAHALLRSADAAVYSAKANGRAQVRTFVGELSAQAEERLRLSGELRDALANEQLHLIYQPVLDLASGDVTGVEALARWQHPERGPVPPDVFVGVAEKTGMARALDEWVLERACREFADRAAAGDVPPACHLAVNVTASSLTSGDFGDTVQRVLRSSGLPADRLVVEVTETGIMNNLDAAVRTLGGLRAQGIRVAIDDFGTGWSSLAYLKHLPADVLKVDRSFIARLDEDEADVAIAAAVIQLGRATGMLVVAEGVETEGQLKVLRRLHCDAAQGWLWHRGVPAAELRPTLAEVAAHR